MEVTNTQLLNELVRQTEIEFLIFEVICVMALLKIFDWAVKFRWKR